MKIEKVVGAEILDSRGNPTVRVTITLNNGISASASVPSGASTGSHEALELRDNDPARYGGKGVLTAIKNVNGPLARAIHGLDVRRQRKIDAALIKADGTTNKSTLGANAILGVSLACAHASATTMKMPLYRSLRTVYSLPQRTFRLPYATMNILNGGRHADTGLSIQEFMIIPRASRFSERVRMGAEIFATLRTILKKQGYPPLVGDEGGFAPKLLDNERTIRYILTAITKSGYVPGKDVDLGLDLASSEFIDAKTSLYALNPKKKQLTSDQMIEELNEWVGRYPLALIEDGLAEDDWDAWKKLTKKLGKKTLLVGDDLFVTNIDRLIRGIDMKVANAILIKLNQIGSLTETIDCITHAQKHHYTVIISHRSGETADTTIADLAVAVNAEYIKTGSLSRSERVEKYNRLMEIEHELKGQR